MNQSSSPGSSGINEASQAVKPVAVIDCGTNTTRLLITAGDSAEVLRIERITGLGRGLKGSNAQLQPDAIDRVLAVLDEFAELIAEHGTVKVRAVATSAAREASNSEQFLAAATSRLGYQVELLSSQDEARFSFGGATTGLSLVGNGTDAVATVTPTGGPADSPVGSPQTLLVIDIGGGSTEFTLGQAVPSNKTPDSETLDGTAVGTGPAYQSAEILDWWSLPLGSVRFTEQYLHSDPPKPEELSAVITVTRQYLDDIDRELPLVRKANQLIGVAGTITTMAAVELGLAQYDPSAIDNFVLKRAAAEDVFRTLATEPLAQRIRNPGLASERAPVIVAGCCIAVAIMRHWEFDRCRVRHHDLLDGVAIDLLA